MNNSLFSGGGEHAKEGCCQGSSTESSPRHLLGLSDGCEGSLNKEKQSLYIHQQIAQQINPQDECNTGSVYHELQPCAPSSQMSSLSSPTSSISAMPGSAHQYSSDTCYYGNDAPRPPSSYFNSHNKMQLQQSPPFISASDGCFSSDHDHSSSYYHQHQQHLQGEPQRMLPYFPALASSMNSWVSQAEQHQEQQTTFHGYSHHAHLLHHNHQHPHPNHYHLDMATPFLGGHESPTSFVNSGDSGGQGRSSSNGSNVNTATMTPNKSNMLSPTLYPAPQNQPGVPLQRQTWLGAEAENPNTSNSSAVMAYHRSQHAFSGFSHHLQGQGHPYGHNKSRAMSQWTATGKSKITVTLYNGDMWAKFHEHTNEMIITKHGR